MFIRVPEIFLFLCRTLNSDIVTQSNALSNQLSTHDTDIKSLLNNRGCVKSVQRIIKTVNTAENDSIDVGINYSQEKQKIVGKYKSRVPN